MKSRFDLPPWRPWIPDIGLGVALIAVGLAQASTRFGYGGTSGVGEVVVAVGMGLAAALFRRAPGGALLAVWAACAAQVLSGTEALVTQLAAVVVAYGTARYGRPVVRWLGALSIPLGAAAAAVLVLGPSGSPLVDLSAFRVLLPDVGRPGPSLAVTGGLFALAVLAVPWLAGLAVRARAQAQVSKAGQVIAERARARAELAQRHVQEIADLRAGQTRLIRDVHDVVGHSLAVILMQAESAQFLADADTVRIRGALANIAVSARQSLRDVREVLSATGDPVGSAGSAGPAAGLDSLIGGMRDADNELRSEVTGVPRPLAPEVAVVAFRVLQEMLTNAMKHGRRDEPTSVARHWDSDLRIEVRNVIDDRPREPAAVAAGGEPGLGLGGMRQRLDQVGGRLDVGRRIETAGPTFTVTAWIPLGNPSGTPS